MKHQKNNIAEIPPPRPRKDPICAAADYGIDIQMLIDNMARTPAERVRRHQIALETFRALRRTKLVKSIGEIRNIGGGRRIRVLTIDSLIKAGKAMNRPRDREAVLQLEAIKKMQKKKRKV